MITVYPAEKRFSADHGWLKTSFSFSFAEYYDPTNMNFGPMRVLNDDFIAPNRGFGTHPHKEMEIVSIVLEGQLKHEDSTGQTATTTFGEIQRMSAGTGVFHSEVNPSSTEEVNLLQLWFIPESNGIEPSYEKTSFDMDALKNKLLPVVSKQSKEGIAHIHQDLTIYLSDLEEGKIIQFEQKPGRKVFLFTIEGNLKINEDFELAKRDSARITETETVHIKANSNSRLMLIDLP
ncbi:pirin family protein [Cytobacillus spongiae]|uniref:pirin family protein n=1 Tax=Cytobacillus spongiae TaxID=2901381 RepID=UPI001F247702|nr:pirin family protein [Cytobacillus spongiae]UII56759.1 pirin family protein [Cytobacillus spongiae]